MRQAYDDRWDEDILREVWKKPRNCFQFSKGTKSSLRIDQNFTRSEVPLTSFLAPAPRFDSIKYVGGEDRENLPFTTLYDIALYAAINGAA